MAAHLFTVLANPCLNDRHQPFALAGFGYDFIHTNNYCASILRQAMGTQQTPPNQVLIAIALFLSLFIMMPTLTRVYDDAVNHIWLEISAEQAINDGSDYENFRFAIRAKRFGHVQRNGWWRDIETPADVPFSIALPAYYLRVKSAFQIGFLLFLPFL